MTKGQRIHAPGQIVFSHTTFLVRLKKDAPRKNHATVITFSAPDNPSRNIGRPVMPCSLLTLYVARRLSSTFDPFHKANKATVP